MPLLTSSARLAGDLRLQTRNPEERAGKGAAFFTYICTHTHTFTHMHTYIKCMHKQAYMQAHALTHTTWVRKGAQSQFSLQGNCLAYLSRPRLSPGSTSQASLEERMVQASHGPREHPPHLSSPHFHIRHEGRHKGRHEGSIPVPPSQFNTQAPPLPIKDLR